MLIPSTSTAALAVQQPLSGCGSLLKSISRKQSSFKSNPEKDVSLRPGLLLVDALFISNL